MGGKHKQVQRVKNNARPSSSGRSAERLGASVAAPFASAFAVRKDSDVRVGALLQSATVDEPLPQLDPALDPQFQLVLKKMNKKDGTTKLKALHEFKQLVEASDAEAVCLVTGLWCRVYVGLLSGGDGRVREAAHRAHEVVCSRACRSLAPHIRLLAAPWLAAVHDTYGPAAQAARDSLLAAFPDAGRRAELAARCRRQLLQQALDVLVTVKSTEPRVVSCALLAAASACEQSSATVGEADAEAATLLRQLLEDERFWGCADVCEGRECERVALAAVLAAASRDPWREAATVDVNRILRAATRTLIRDDCAPDATPALWDAVLLLLPHCGLDALQDVRALLLKPLAARLRDPPPAYVARTCPALLPLLSRLERPSEDKRDVHARLLMDAVLECMLLPRVQHSRTELRAAATAYMDIAQWVSAADAPAECVRRVLCSADTCRNARVIHVELARLMRRWRTDAVWHRLADLAVEARGPQLLQIADVLVWLARPAAAQDVCLQNKRVTFGDIDTSDNVCIASTHEIAIVRPTADEDLWYSSRLDEQCGKVTDEWLGRCEESHASSALCALLDARRALPLSAAAANALEENVLPVLRRAPSTDVPGLIELAFQLLGRPGDEQRQRQALDSLPATCVTYAVLFAQHEPHISRLVVREWLRSSPLVRETYERVARETATVPTADHVPDEEDDLAVSNIKAVDDCELLVRALRSRPPLCDKDCVMSVSQVLRDALLSGQCTRALCRLAAAACEHAPDLLAAPLLAVTCASGDLIDAQVAWDVESAWKDALRDRPHELRDPLADTLVKLAGVSEFRRDHDDRLVHCAVTLVETCDNDNSAHVLLRPYLPEVEKALVRRVALAQHVSGRDVYGGYPNTTSANWHAGDGTQSPSADRLASWLGWRRLVARTAFHLHEQQHAVVANEAVSNDADEREHMSSTNSDALRQLVVRVLYDYSLVACHALHYSHTDDTGIVRTWLEDVRRICDQIWVFSSLSSWTDAAPDEVTSDENTAITWAACTAHLASQGLLPGSSKIVPLHGRIPHAAHLARALASERILDPRRVPPAGSGLTSLEATRLSLLAASEDDTTACATATAEAAHALRLIGAEPPGDRRELTGACLLLGAALCRTPAAQLPALLDLATVRVAAWSQAAIDGDDPRSVATYCHLAAEHWSALQRYTVCDGGARATEHGQLFANNVRRAILGAYSICIALAGEGAAAAWPLCRAVSSAAALLVPAGDEEIELWRVSLRALCPPDHVRCVPVQLLAHSLLRQLCDGAAAAVDERSCQTAVDVDLRAALACAQDATPFENDDPHATLGLVLAWDAAAPVHAAWEQPRADLLLGRVLNLVPRDACDEWFACERLVTCQLENHGASGPEHVLAQVACHAYTRWLCEAGAAARAWWLSVPVASDRQRAEHLAARHVTRRAVKHQLQTIRLPLGVACQTTGRHVQAECHVEDARIELRLELGESWPLGQRPPHVEARPQPHRDRLMQLTLAAAAGAPLHRLLRLWKEAVDSRYEGLDECHICFSLLHAATAQLPRLRCPTCRKTFHSACLYRWFSTSNKSTCPICRNLF